MKASKPLPQQEEAHKIHSHNSIKCLAIFKLILCNLNTKEI